MKKKNPPRATKKPKRIVKHGDLRVDNYFWLREKENPEVMRYLKDENAYFAQEMRPTLSLQKKIFKEMKSRLQPNDSSVPSPRGNYCYYQKFVKGKQYILNCRTPRDGGKEEIILDSNKLAQGKKYFRMGGEAVSPDQNFIAYAFETDGSEIFTIHIKDLRSGKVLKDRILHSNGNFEWCNDSRTLIYVQLNDNHKATWVFRHRIGEAPKNDQLLYHEKDGERGLWLSKSESDQYFFLSASQRDSSEIWYMNANESDGVFQCFQKAKENLEYSVTHQGDFFWVLTNLKGKNFQLMKTSLSKTALANWKMVFANSKTVYRRDVNAFEKYLVLSELENGLPQIRIFETKSGKQHVIEFKDPAYEVAVSGDNYEYQTDVLRLSYSTPITPVTKLAYLMNSRKKVILKKDKVPHYNEKKYAVARVWVTSHDGAKVPMTLISKKGVRANGTASGLLYGYGSYGILMPDGFDRSIFSLVDRGFVYAVAHIRGGSEMGRQWYDDARFLKKKNTFYDFIACAEFLKKNKWVHSRKLAISGGSAGGLLMGAVINMRPDLFDAVTAHVPFVDVVNTMFDRTLPLTEGEFKEWGNPEEKKFYRYMKSYSPYDNVEAKAYPPMMVTAGLNDHRVTYWEPAKWVAKLRELKTNDSLLVYKTNMGMGHFGKSGRFGALWSDAEDQAFVISMLARVR